MWAAMMNHMPLKLSLQNQASRPECQPILQEIGDELLVCEPATGRVHLLTSQVALVYRACDGKTPADQVAVSLGEDGQQVLAQCLAQLEQVHLLAPPTEDSSSRRQFLVGASVASAALITSISLPYPVAAASGCITTGNAGCAAAFLPLIGGSNRPLGCGAPCCGAGCVPACPCSTCQCFAQYRCRDSGGNIVVCSAGGVDICQSGSNDTFESQICREPNAVNVALSCAAARALAGSSNTNYRCCQCP
jgi:hypothetical protein